MAALLDEQKQYTDELTGELINAGYIYVGTQSLDPKLNLIAIYSDRDLLVPIANPQRTGADGRAVNKIWVPDFYSLAVYDTNDVQKYIQLDNGSEDAYTNAEIDAKTIDKYYDTLALAITDVANLSAGNVVILAERSTGNGGALTGDVVAFSGSENEVDLVPLSATLSLQVRVVFPVDPRALGAIDATTYTAMIATLSNGDSLKVTGQNILNTGIDFTHDDLTIVMDQGAEFYQADGTQDIDSLITVSGDRVRWTGGKISANITGNPDIASSNGRGESMRWSGDYANCSDIHFNESHAVTVGLSNTGVAAGLYVQGQHGLFDKTYINDAGNACVRDHGDYNAFTNQRYNEFDNKGFLKDSGFGGLVSNYTYVHIAHAVTTSTNDIETVLFDHNAVQGGEAVVEFGYISAPNVATAPDIIKFAYLDSVTLRGFRGDHATTSFAITLRLQQGITKCVIDDCVFPGAINFDADTGVNCNLLIKGGSIICDTIETTAAIQDFGGYLNIEDGCSLKNLREYAITTDVDHPDTIVNLGRIHLHGATTIWTALTAFKINDLVSNSSNVYQCTTSGTSASSGGPTGTGTGITDGTVVWDYIESLVSYTPAVINNLSVVNTINRTKAGNITVAEPLSITGTMKSRQVDGRWIGLSDAQDVGCAQTGARIFLSAGSDFPPREIEGYQTGDIVRKREPAAGDSIAEYWCTTAGAACTPTWITSTVYATNGWASNSGNVYFCVAGGTSGATAPTHTSGTVSDGTLDWTYIDTLAVFKGVSSITA